MAQDRDDNYRQSGFGHSVGFGERPALLIVDFVQAYLDRTSPLYAGVEDVLERCIRLLAGARGAAIPVFHSCVSYRPGSADGGAFRRKLPLLACFEEGSPYAAFAPGLEPAAGESVIVKQYASAFFATPLAANLTAAGIDTLVIAGLTTSGCVRATAVDAIQHGFHPLVVRDAVGDRHTDPHEANLFDLEAKYADVVAIDEVLSALAATPRNSG